MKNNNNEIYNNEELEKWVPGKNGEPVRWYRNSPDEPWRRESKYTSDDIFGFVVFVILVLIFLAKFLK